MKKKLLSLLLVFCLAFVPASIVPVFAEEPDGSKGNPFVTIEQYNNWVNTLEDEESSNVDVYVTISGNQNFTEDNLFNPSNAMQNWTYPPRLHLTIEGCTFTGNTWSETDKNTAFMYLCNCKSLVIKDCKFDAEGGLVYGINWNLCTITDATVEITDCTFDGTYTKNAIKLNQRGGADDKAIDIAATHGGNPVPASISEATISGCSFNGSNAVILLGTQGKNTDGAASPSTGNFPITIENNDTAVDVQLAYASGKDVKIDNVPTIKLNETGTMEKKTDSIDPLDAVIYVSEVVNKNDPYYVKLSGDGNTSSTTAKIKYYSDASCTDEIDDVPLYTAPTTRPTSTTTERSLGYRLPMITKEQKGFDSDTTQNFTVNGKYQFRITSLNGQVPVMTCGNNAFTVELASQEGNDYFFVIRTAVPGSTGTIYVNGYYLLVAAAA